MANRTKIGGAMANLEEILGQSAALEAVREKVTRLLRQSGARRLPPVLICGETGTGKGLLARAIHQAGPRAGGPFVDVNCAAIPETLLESEMFGYERGAFTDARQPKAGLFQAAQGGSIFLDEVGLLPDGLQAKLLKVIEQRTVRRLGATRSEPVDVWILTATNEDLAAATSARRFREDLYFRLAVLTLRLPPLRERGQDAITLASHFLARACADYDLAPKSLAPDACAAILAYPWPGNVRELNNVIERVALLMESPQVTAEVLALPAVPPAASRAAVTRGLAVSLSQAVDAVEREHLGRALEECGWNISRAAALLGISRNTIRYRIEKHGLRPGTMPPAMRRRAASARPVSPASSPSEELPVVATLPAPTAAPPSSVPSPMPPVMPSVVRWEPRRVTLLRAALLTPPDVTASSYNIRGADVLVDKVKSFGGRVEELSLTGLVAAFGLEPIENAPGHAAHAAMAIRKAAERETRSSGGQPDVRLGLHVGQFLVGEVNGMAQIDLDAKQNAWRVLEALVTAAEPNAILVSDAAEPFLRRTFAMSPAGGLGPAPFYRLIGREYSALGRRAARFVGRREDLEFLETRLASAMAGHGQTVGIVGEAGIGKSRLIAEFRQRLRQKPVTCLEGRCFSYGSAVPYLPILTILRQNFGITGVHSPETITEKVRAGLAVLEMDQDEWTPYLLQLMGVKHGEDKLGSLSPEAVKSRTLEALRQLTLRGSRRRPIIFVLEDIHWIDKTSEEWVASLVDSGAGSTILFLATYRPGYRPAWLDKSYAAQIALQPLSSDESLSVVQSILQSEKVPEPLARLILAKAEGNPFFLEELSRSVGEQGNLEPTLTVPDTVQEVLLARMYRLPETTKQAVQTAAVLGREFSLNLLESIWDSPEPLAPHLRTLVQLEFLHRQPEGAEPVYMFKHALTQEVVYESLSLERRRALHAAAGHALEKLYAGRLEEAYEELAYHYSRTEQAETAFDYLTRFARKAASLYAHEEVVRALQTARAHVKRLPPEQRDRQGLELALRQASSLMPLGRVQEIVDLLLPERVLVEQLQNPALAGHYYVLLGWAYSFLADRNRAAESAQRAIAEADRCGDAATKGKAICLLAQDGPLSGRAREGIEQGRQAVALLEPTGERWWLCYAHWVVGLNYGQIGSFEPAFEALAQASAIAEAMEDPRLQTLEAWARGILHAAMGDTAEGIDACRRALECAADPLNQSIAMGWLGFAYTQAGDSARAIPLLERAAAMFGRLGYRPYQGWFTAFLAEAYRIKGDQDQASELAGKAFQIGSDSRVWVVTGWARHSFGRIALCCGDLAEAEKQLLEALRIFDSIQSRYEMACAHMDLASVAHARGRTARAAAHLGEALQIFRTLHVPRYVERVGQLAREFHVSLPVQQEPGATN
jgi:DNA-binding NtrC family response regulator/tetratricopeptide (TPR) repeat protein/ABC-type dipeptide/oligopeptide/nickel transport system ATPase component